MTRDEDEEFDELYNKYLRAQAAAKVLNIKYQQLEFFTAILLAVSEHRAKSLEVMENFIADLKKASEQ